MKAMPSRKRRESAGFTMIEILVVLVVVGLLAALAIVNLGGSAQKREMENEIREIYLLMQTASEQAILNSQELGWMVEEGGYRFLLFDDETASWTKLDERLFRPRRLPEWLTLTPLLENNMPRLTSDEEALRPDIVFFSSGETTPFELQGTIGRDTDAMHIILSDGFSGLEWLRPGDDEEER